MAETSPMMLQALCYTATDFRLQLASLVCGEGVAGVNDGALLVTTGGAGLDLSVAQGAAFITSDVADQGMYSVYNDAPETVTATAADPTDPRIDQVIATVNDSQIIGVDDDWVLSVLAGTPTAGATLTNLNGAAALPDRSIRLAYVLVPATFVGPFVNATHILDVRTEFVQCGDPSVPSVKAFKSSSQALTSGVAAPIVAYNTFTQSSNDNAYWTYSAGIYTMDRDGVLNIVGTAEFAANSDSTFRRLQILVNGSAFKTVTLPAVNSASIATIIQATELDIDLNRGDTVQLQVTAGASINLSTANFTLSRSGVLAA